MKHLKQFENIDRRPRVGDYVIVELTDDDGFKFNNKICKIIQTDIGSDFSISKICYGINVCWIHINDIKHISKSQEKLKVILQANKYNL